MKKIAFITLTAALSSISAHAATILVNNNFETGTLESWTAVGVDAGLYRNGDVVGNMGTADALIDYAPNGEYAMWEGRLNSYLELTNSLPLDTQGYTQISVSFNYIFRNGSGTRRLRVEYSSDGGSNWETHPSFATGSGSANFVFNEADYSFTDDAKFRFTFADSGGAAGPVFIDDVVISGMPEYIIPEPSAALLGSLGMLCLLRRRR
jgi:hypothetical protein